MSQSTVEYERVTDARIRALVKDLHEARPAIFWIDFLASAVGGWVTLVAAVVLFPAHPWSSAGSALISSLAFYRGLCFTHEITHLRRRAVPGFETTWNLLIGIPFLLPSFTYVGVHQNHHNLSTYGTKDDPEYLPFASSRRLILTFAVQSSLLIPVVLVLRFVLLTPLGLVWPAFHRWLAAHASSFSMNPSYVRQVAPDARARMRRWEAVTCAIWLAAFLAVYREVLPLHAVALFGAVMVVVCLMNTLRVLGAHAYDSKGEVLDRQGQLLDSIDTPGGPWTELWAPVGLRYHALHHYFPGIPYHNLGSAYRRILSAIPSDALYRQTTNQSLRYSLGTLYAKAKKSNGLAPRPAPRAAGSD